MSTFAERNGKSGYYALVGDIVEIIHPYPPYVGGERVVVKALEQHPVPETNPILTDKKGSPLVAIPCILDNLGNYIPKQAIKIVGRQESNDNS